MQPLPVTKAMPLLKFLEATFPDLSRTEVKRFLKYDSVRLNGRSVTQFDYRVKPGDDIRVLTKGETRGLSGLGNVHIIFEDNALLVVNKPPGLLTIATQTEKEKTLYFRLNHYLREKTKGKERVFVVHRLDREVSGLIVFAKTEELKLKLQKNWNRFEKIYYAVVEGAPPKNSGVVQSFITEDRIGNASSGPETRDSKEAITHYEVLQSLGRYTLIQIQLETGRKNQIRVHMNDIGCPVAGDDKYGAKSNPIDRLALHAAKIRFAHPVSGEPLAFELPPPALFLKLR
jgi:23S rRNA pseudouridine1911/1915/1917 synthase